MLHTDKGRQECDIITLLTFSCRKDFEINQLTSKIEDEQALSAQYQKKLKELQVI